VDDEPQLDWDQESALILAIMRLEAKIDEMIRLLAEDDEDGEEEEPES
jgi:hypothetical protein